MLVHVSIHDVSPAWASEVEVALALCARFGARPALLVVPDFHGAWPLQDHPSYCQRLRVLEEEGHEVLLHGFFHQSRARRDAAPTGEGTPRGLRWLFAQRVASAGEAEFSDVSRKEARERLEAGEQALARAGLSWKGFVPPAWSMPPWVRELLGERGYAYTEDHLHVYEPRARRGRASVVLNFASRTTARKLSSVAWCRLARAGGRLAPVRIALHPGDMRSPLLRGEAEGLLRWGSGAFVSSVADLLA